MRVSVFVSVALVAVLLAEGTSSGSCVQLLTKPRANPREIRGFKPELISTAYGFGKRQIAQSQDKYERIMMLLRNSPQSIPVTWWLHEMRKNPDLVKRIARKIADDGEEENPGKLSTSELFKSERTISFF